MMRLEIFRKYKYIGPEHTMVRKKEREPKKMVYTGETFISVMDKNYYPSRLFEFLGETTEDMETPKTVEETLITKTIEQTKEVLIGKKKASELYQAKFGKRPFPGRDEQTILSKLS